MTTIFSCRTIPFVATIASILACGAVTGLADDDKAPTWRKDATQAEIPAAPAIGMAHGKAFKLEKATISGSGILKLRVGKEFFADIEFMIFTFVHEEKDIPGTKFKIEPGNNGSSPHIHFKYKVADKAPRGSEIFMGKYSMVLEFGEEGEDGIPGKIYLCLPDDKKSFIAGTFVAKKD